MTEIAAPVHSIEGQAARPLTVWLVQIGEPSPTDPEKPKLMRTAIVAETMANRGHEVVLWNTTVNHATKTQRATGTTIRSVRPTYQVILLYGCLYRHNLSVARVVSQIQYAREFRLLAPKLAKPDVILCGYPSVELAYEATAFAVRNSIPIVIDFRDKWPDVIEDHLPRWGRPLAAPIVSYWRRRQRWTVQNATAVVGITEPFVDWALSCANRARSVDDRAFHLAIDPARPSSQDMTEAEQFWDAQGIAETDDKIVACFSGTLSRRHDFQAILGGLQNLSDAEKKRLRIVVCGRGDMESELRQVARSEPALLVAGWRSAAELTVLMRRAHIGILPYKSAGDFVISYPNKVGEYLSAGLPIFTGLSGLVRELVAERDIGILYEEGSSRSVAECLRSLLADPSTLHAMKGPARKTFEDLFDPSVIYPAFCDYVEEVAGRRDNATNKTVAA
jgi:glycosyltransferase involved in cell wall biosynthesis